VEVVRREEAATVRSALDSLPGEQCRVIELAYFGGFTHTQIARMLEMPVGTLKAHTQDRAEPRTGSASRWPRTCSGHSPSSRSRPSSAT
jgi:RNA polymerase sigma-70 factor, ECF subfamily